MRVKPRWLVPLLPLALASPGSADDPPIALPVPVAPQPPAEGDEPAKPARVFDPATQTALANEDLGEVVKSRLRLSSLRDDERRAIRLRHGVWAAEDLSAPADRAAAALDRGAFDDASFNDPAVSPVVKAEALLAQGKPDAALATLGGKSGPGAEWIRVRALLDLGRADDALKAGAPALDALAGGTLDRAGDIADAVRTASLVLELRAPKGAPGDEHRMLISQLARARTLDPLEWKVRLAEADLLFDKDNFEEAQQSVREALRLNPGAAEAWALLGQMAVAGYNLAEAEKIALRIDQLQTLNPLSDAAPADAADQPAEGAEGAAPIRTSSPLAAGVRARAMMRQDDPELAEQALAGAIERFPTRRDLRAWAVGVSALRYDWKTTDRLLTEFDALCPGSARGYFEAGRAMADARQYAQSAKWLNEACARAPHWPAPVAELGLLEVQSGRDREAIDALERAAALDPFNVRVENSLKLMKELQSYERTESPHFVVRSRPGLDTLLAHEMLTSLERLHSVVTGDRPGALAFSPEAKTVIDLMPDHEWFAVRIAGLPAIHTIAASTGPVIAMEAPRNGRGHRGAYDWERVVRHEYTHTVGLARTRSRIPHWFTEANAVYLELAPRDAHVVTLLAGALGHDSLFDFTQINIAFTRPRKATDRPLAYAQGHWMFQYMVERFGREAPLKLMDVYAQGTREEQGFQSVLGVSRDAFMTDFKAWAHEQVVSWGLAPAKGQPTLADLWDEARKEHEASGKPGELGDEATPELIEGWLAKHPDHPEVVALKLKKALQANPAPGPELRPLLLQAARVRPMDPMPVRHLARLALASPTPADAIPLLEWLDAREQSTPAYASQLASLYFAQGDLVKAQDKAERATRIAPYEASHRELAAAIAVKLKDFATARRHIEMLIALEPDREIHKKRLDALGKLSG